MTNKRPGPDRLSQCAQTTRRANFLDAERSTPMKYEVSFVTCRICGGTLNDARPKVLDAPQVGGGSVGIGMIHKGCEQEEEACRV